MSTPQILISNLGNRNIKYQGEIVLREEFRQRTAALLADWDACQSDLSLEIIPNYIDANIEKIYLITTNQTDERHNYQDTCFEGEIVKRLIEAAYKIPVELLEYTGNPTDEDRAIAALCPQVKDLLQQHPNATFKINDAGGTPQMKQAIKEIFGYYQPQYGIVYTNQSNETRTVAHIFSEKFTLLRTAQHFVEQYDYGTALDIIQTIPPEARPDPKNSLCIYLQLADYRINLDWEDANSAWNREKLPEAVQCSDLLKQFIEKNYPETSIPIANLKPQRKADLFEAVSLCQVRIQQGRYTLGTALFYHVLERLFSAYVETVTSFKLDKDSGRRRFVEAEFADLQAEYSFLRNDTYGLPFQIAYAAVKGDTVMREIAHLIMPTLTLFRRDKTGNQQQRGIDSLRNKSYLAHKTKAVKKQDIDNILPDFLSETFPRFLTLLGMPDQNIYDQMNDELYAILQQQ